jgi:hypothetical protein
MKVFILISCLVIMFPFVSSAGGFDNLLKEVLVETTGQPLGGTNEYDFAPGDAVIQKDTYVVYYSGSEISAGVRTLLLTMVTAGDAIELKYPNPEEIRVKSFRLQVLQFDNSNLRVRIIER